MTETLALPFGCMATLVYGDTDTEPIVQEKAKAKRTKRWVKNGHLWETYTCPECRARQRNDTGSGCAAEER